MAVAHKAKLFAESPLSLVTAAAVAAAEVIDADLLTSRDVARCGHRAHLTRIAPFEARAVVAGMVEPGDREEGDTERRRASAALDGDGVRFDDAIEVEASLVLVLRER